MEKGWLLNAIKRGKHKSINNWTNIIWSACYMQSLRHSYHTIPYHAIRYRIVFCNMCQYFSYVHFFLLTVIRSILVIKPSNHVNNICVSQLPEIGNQSLSFFHMTLIHMNKASSGSAWEWSESVFFFIDNNNNEKKSKRIHSTNIF